MTKIKWLETPEEHDYPAAESYLTLLMPNEKAKDRVKLLRESEISSFKAKDIFRASELSLLGVSNSHVKKNIEKIEKRIPMSPLLLVRENGRIIVADGYHRLCAVYTFDEDMDVPCKIV